MKKIIVGIAAIGLGLSAVPAHALFTNGGFETGNFTGWTLTGTGASLPATQVINTATPMLTGQTTDIDPYYGNYMARLQDLEGWFSTRHTTTLSQTATIAAADLTEDLYVRWGALLIEPSNPHDAGNQPAFDIAVLKNGSSIGSFHADALTKQGGGWTDYGDLDGTAWYKSEVWSFDLSNFSIGDQITVEMTVTDCGWSGHGGAAFLDGIGTTPVVVDPVPEPATMLLFGTGLAGLAGAIRRRKTAK